MIVFIRGCQSCLCLGGGFSKNFWGGSGVILYCVNTRGQTLCMHYNIIYIYISVFFGDGSRPHEPLIYLPLLCLKYNITNKFHVISRH